MRPERDAERTADESLDETDRGALRVVVLGASGHFGGRLVRRLAAEPGVTVLASARGAARLDDLARELPSIDTWPIDRERLDAAALRERRADVLIDATGPFQGLRPTLAEAAIAAGVHYIDLADARDFVTGIERLDDAARRAGVAVISGASSTPALSHAVIDALVSGWRRIDTVGATICPSNRQRVGLAVVRSILSTLGQPVRVFDEGGWTRSHGWSGTRRFRFPGIGRRYVSLVETPDLALFASRYRPTMSATFEAGLGLPFEHLALSVIATLVRIGALRSAVPLARPLHALGNRLRRFGVDVGAMEVRVSGIDAEGVPARARWRLAASGDSGPNVPVLAAVALVRRLRDGTLGFTGATPCTGLLGLTEFEDDLAGLGIATATTRTARRLGDHHSGRRAHRHRRSRS